MNIIEQLKEKAKVVLQQERQVNDIENRKRIEKNGAMAAECIVPLLPPGLIDSAQFVGWRFVSANDSRVYMLVPKHLPILIKYIVSWGPDKQYTKSLTYEFEEYTRNIHSNGPHINSLNNSKDLGKALIAAERAFAKLQIDCEEVGSAPHLRTASNGRPEIDAPQAVWLSEQIFLLSGKVKVYHVTSTVVVSARTEDAARAKVINGLDCNGCGKILKVTSEVVS